MTVEVTMHLDGPVGTAEIWYRVTDTSTGEWIGCESRSGVSERRCGYEGSIVLQQALSIARDHLSAF